MLRSLLLGSMLLMFVGELESSKVTEAPASFEGTNGFVEQAQQDSDQAVFVELEEIDDGLGPVYNAQSCGECHQNPRTGGISQVTELRAAAFRNGLYIDHPGGSLIQARAVSPDIQERVFETANVRALRISLNLFGDGFVECIDSDTLKEISERQPEDMKGFVHVVPVLEAPGKFRVGRFGWKAQQASLLSFSADAYINEMGITNELIQTENTSNGRFVGFGTEFDDVQEPENITDITKFTRFIRSLPAPPRDIALASEPDTQLGETLFRSIGCAVCHIPTIVTAPAGTPINGGAFNVPEALGSKAIHPYSDFLLHDIGTGDGIIQGDPQTRNKMRTPPLWGNRTHDRLMHDGLSFTRNDAIVRHAGQASEVIKRYRALPNDQKNAIIHFLNSL